MVQSPTKRGVVVIGGRKGTRQESNILIELSGESREALQWTILDQKLQRGRCAHVSFLVPDETVTQLIQATESQISEFLKSQIKREESPRRPEAQGRSLLCRFTDVFKRTRRD